jgi:hypothetical protein
MIVIRPIDDGFLLCDFEALLHHRSIEQSRKPVLTLHIQPTSVVKFMNNKIFLSRNVINLPVKSKAIPVTGREGPSGCETSRVPHFLDSRLTEIVSPTHRPPFPPRKIPGTHFC